VQPNANRNILIIVLVFIAIVFGGIMLGFWYSRLPSNNPQKSQAGCESVGGDWDAVAGRCLVSYKKEGEPCVDGGQCKSGICFPPTLTEEQEVVLLGGHLKNVVGTCYSDEQITGCVKQVLMGIVSKESMCLD